MARRKKGKAVHGWLVLDKPAGMTSTQAVGAVRRAFDARKAGHAGTLDPLATGILPIALGEATKTVPYAVEGEKGYRFTVRWGAETDTDDAEGRTGRRPARHARSRGAIEPLLPRFVGEILQTPPAFSAIKIDGERAYDLARAGETVELEPRPVRIDALDAASTRPIAILPCSRPAAARARTCARLRATWAGRSAASATSSRLRRTRVGPFAEADAVSMDDAAGGGRRRRRRAHAAAACRSKRRSPTLPSSMSARTTPARLLRGQSVLIRGRDAPAAHRPHLCDLQGPPDRGRPHREGRAASEPRVQFRRGRIAQCKSSALAGQFFPRKQREFVYKALTRAMRLCGYAPEASGDLCWTTSRPWPHPFSQHMRKVPDVAERRA